MSLHHLTRNRSVYLLSAMIVFFLINPLAVNSQEEMYIFGASFSIVIFFSVVVIRRGLLLIIPASLLALMTLGSFWSNRLLFYHNYVNTLETLLSIVFFLLISMVVVHDVIKDKNVRVNTLCGAICGYLLIALCWSFSYLLIFQFDNTAFHFDIPLNTNIEQQSQQFIYFSFVTQSTLGYGDILPISLMAKTLSWLQAVFGQIYLTVWIAHLVGLYIANKNQLKTN